MKIFKKIGISMVLLSALFVSCGTNDDDDSSSGGDSSGFTVGSEISFDGGKYLVLKNDFDSSLSASANISSRAVIKSDSGSYYQNENAEKLRRNKIESDYGISNYIELFKVTTRKEASRKGIASLKDEYLILNESKKEVFKVTQTWSSITLFSGTVAEKSEQFNALTENQIREYDPDYFTYENKKALYGNDLSKKIQTQYVYTRSENEKTVDYTKIDSIRDWKDYKKMSDKKEKAVWRSAVYNPGTEYSSTFYYLLNMTGSNFLSIYRETNYISAEGDGNLDGSTSTSVWQGVVTPTSVNAEAATFNVSLKNEDAKILGKTFTVTYSELDSTKEVTTSDAEYYISVSDETKTLNGTDVPSKITFTAPFKDTSVALQKYTSVSWYPSLDDSNEIVYSPNYKECIAKYDEDFAALYDQCYYPESTVTESIIETFNTESTVSPTTSVTGEWNFSVYNSASSLPGGVKYNTNYDSSAFPVALTDSAMGTQTGASLSIVGGAGIKWKYESEYSYGLYTSRNSSSGEYSKNFKDSNYVMGKLSLVLEDTSDVTLNASGNGDIASTRWVVLTDDKDDPTILGAASYLYRSEDITVDCIKQLSLKKLPAGTYYIWMCGSRLNGVKVDNSDYLSK